MKRHYETMIAFDGTLSEETLQKEQKQIEEFYKQNASFEKTEVLGKRALAYPIRKKRSGVYCLFLYEGDGDVENAFVKHIKLNESILRHLTVLRNLKNEAARAAAVVRREKAAEAEHAPRRSESRDDDQE